MNSDSRPCVLRNSIVEGSTSRVRHVEVMNAQHFDSFLPFAGCDNRGIPRHLYFGRALEAMWAHLKPGAALPPWQLARTTPRVGSAGAANATTAGHAPAISVNPAAANRFVIEGLTLRLPE